MLGYRFDDKPGRDEVASRILHGYQVIVIEDRAAVEAGFAACPLTATAGDAAKRRSS